MAEKPKGISQETAEAYALLGVPYEGYVEGVGYQSLLAQTLGSCYFQERGCAIPQFEPVMDSSPEMRIQSVGYKHKVKAGETLTSISQYYGATIASIMSANPGIDWPNARNNGDLIFAGEVLALPNLGALEVLPKDPSASTCMFQFAPSNEVRGMMGGETYAYIDAMVTKSFELGCGKITVPVVGYSLNTKKSGVIDPRSTYASLVLKKMELRGYPFKGGISGEDATVRALITLLGGSMNTRMLQVSGKIQMDFGVSTDTDFYLGFRLGGALGYTSLNGMRTGAIINIGFKTTEAVPLPSPEISRWITVMSGGAF
jgi:LysM repeat protein